MRLNDTKGVVFSPPLATTGQWTSLGGAGTGLSSIVYDIAIDGGVIYAVGIFTNAGGDGNADRVAKFSGGAWSSLGGAGTGLNDDVYAIAIDGGVIYAGGDFTDAGGDADADRIAKFIGGSWSSLGGVGTGLNLTVEDIVVDGGVIYAGGDFTDAGGDGDADRIAKFTGGAWSSLGGLGTGLNGSVQALAIDGGVVYAGGFFTNAGGDIDADRIGKFDSGVWDSLGGANTGLNCAVESIAIDSGMIYAGGCFTDAGGDANADNIAMFSAGAWSALGTGLNLTVQTVAVDDGIVYAGGFFTDAGGDTDADKIAQFNGGAWSSLGGAGTGLPGTNQIIVIDGEDLYAGGFWGAAGGDPEADNIAQFGIVPPSTSGGTTTGGEKLSKEIASTGTTTLQSGRIIVSVPASAIPGGETNCRIVVQTVGESGDYGFELDDLVWDVKIVCDSGEISLLFAPISICIRPKDGVTTDKQLFHRHGGSWNALASTGELSGYVCGQTQSLSLFTLGLVSLPDTGFAPGVVTRLPEQEPGAAYTASDLTLHIPELGLQMDIVGVPQGPNGWDVSWLGNDAGYLYGTAFPTMVGNTVLTAHVWNANNTPGPFAKLDQLQYGDHFSINAWGQTFTYEVRSNSLVSPNSVRPLAHEDYDWVTLITCQYFDESTGEYALRRVVRAVLVSVE